MSMVAVDPFRERFVAMRDRGEITARGLARELGWLRKPSGSTRVRTQLEMVPDGQRVLRTLGLTTQPSRGRNLYRKRINLDTAEQLCKALGLDPQEVGM